MDDTAAVSEAYEADSTVELGESSDNNIEWYNCDDEPSSAAPSASAHSSLASGEKSFTMWQPIKQETSETWEANYWFKLEAALNKLLTLSPDKYKPLSYEEMYTCVYKSVCLGYQESLCDRLCHLVRSHLYTVANRLEHCSSDAFLTVVNDEMNQYARAMKGIVPIFSYMDRFYVALKMKTELAVVLLGMFAEVVMDKNVSKVLGLLREAQGKPFHVLPSVAANIMKLLYEINHKYVEFDSELFARYMPNMLPQSTINDLPQMIDTTREMQTQLMHTGLDRGDQSRKRRPDSDDFNS